MREIKYRGKPKDTKTNGNWVYCSIITPTHNFLYTIFGYYIYQLNKTNFFTNIKKPKDGYTLILCEVEPKTVGQYTGLKDRNGKEIYEGDVVDKGYIEHWKGMFLVMQHNGQCWSNLAWCHNEIEVIGNIHDNPELLDRGGGE